MKEDSTRLGARGLSGHVARRIILSFTLILAGCEQNNPVDFVALNGGNAFLMVHFRGDGSSGLFLAYSLNGYDWVALDDEKPVLEPLVGSKLLRDPSVLRTNDGIYHLVWTTGWRDRGIGYASSRDLINWSEQIFLPVVVHQQDAKNAWAPSIAYDDLENEFLILWSTTIPGRFPDTDFVNGEDEIWNHRLYSIRTSNFIELSETTLFFDPGYSVIDGCVTRIDGAFVLLFKDEREDPPEKNIRIGFGETIEGPYEVTTRAITGADYWAEGPALARVDDGWIVYFDKYRELKYGAVFSQDMISWLDISESVSFPAGARHGGVIEVTRETINSLLAWSAQ